MVSSTRSYNMGSQPMQNALNLASIERSMPKGANIAPQPLSPYCGQNKAWLEFCERNDIFPRYRKVSIDNLLIPAEEDGDTFKAKAQRYLQHPQSLILRGPSGRGKTHFMFAVLKEIIIANPRLSVRYFDHVELDRKLQDFKTSKYLIESLCTDQILVLDDFGLDTGTQRHERDFYEIFNKRFGKELITIISTNLDAAAIYKYYGERISSRLKEALVVEFNGPDLRGQEN